MTQETESAKSEESLPSVGNTVSAKETRERLKKAAMKAREGAVIGVRHLVDGDVLVRQINEQPVLAPISEGELPEGFSQKILNMDEQDMIAVLYTAGLDIKKMGNRVIPLTRKELINTSSEGGCTLKGFKKSTLKSLKEKEIVNTSLIDFVKTEGDKKTSIGKNTVVNFTVIGRAYVRKYIDREYQPSWVNTTTKRDESSGEPQQETAGAE